MRHSQNRCTRRPHPGSILHAACCAGVAIVQLGCATMGVERLPATERVVGERTESEPAEAVTFNVFQDGTTVAVHAEHKCSLRRYEKVETTEHSTAVNKQAWVDWTLGISGASLLAIGGWTVADSGNVYPNDTSSRTYNDVGPSKARGIGIGTMVTGGALLGVAVVDAVRAQGTTDGEPTVAEMKRGVAGACRSEPVKGIRITAGFGEGNADPLFLGYTDPAGDLKVNLAQIPPPNALAALGAELPNVLGSRLDILGDDKRIGTIDPASMYFAWGAARQRKWDDCENYRGFERGAGLDLALLDERSRKSATRWTTEDVQVVATICAAWKTLPDAVSRHRTLLPPDFPSNPNESCVGSTVTQVREGCGRALPLARAATEAITKASAEATAKAGQERARRQATEAKKQTELRPRCVHCCLMHPGATRDHCDEACNADVRTYLQTGWEGISSACK